MITLKLWNSFDSYTRRKIAHAVLGSNYEPYAVEYHHNFSHDNIGKRIRSILLRCTRTADGTINIVLNLKPAFKPLKKAAEPVLKKYTFRCYSESDPDDGWWEWHTGTSVDDAREQLMHEHWDITRCEWYGKEEPA